MKILALRVAAFRRFSDPAAIEDFAGGVNVLVGPNEMGKSTFFHALEAAFTLRHKTSGAVLEAMRPFSGGEPLVEADFALGDQRWRIRKQFGRGNTAILTDLTAGRVVARSAEAEEKLSNLVDNSDDVAGTLGLVWVRQQRSLHAPDPDIDHLTGKERPRGERNALQDAISHEVDLAAGGAAFDRVQQLTSSALDVLLTPTRNAPRKNGPLELARRRRDETREALELSLRAVAAAEKRLGAIATASADLSALTAPDRIRIRQDELSRLEADVALQVQRRTEFDLAREVLKACLSEAESVRAALTAERTRAERLGVLEKQMAVAVALETDIAELTAGINADPATQDRIDQLSALVRICDIADVEMRANAAHVVISVLPVGARRVRLNGDHIAGATSLDVPESIDISIEDIGNIRVTSAGAKQAENARLRHDDARRQVDVFLSAIGVATIDEARARALARQRRTEDLERARAKLSGIAPLGATALSAEIKKLSVSGALNADLSGLDAKVRASDAAAHAARERFGVIEKSVLSDEGFRKLCAHLDAIRRADTEALRTSSRLSMQIENLKSEQAGADEDGRAGQAETLRGELERHEAEVKRLEAEGLALLLLARTLDGIEAKKRDAYFEPVTRRLKPYLNLVFGGAELAFKDAFALDGMTRAGQHEDFARLSDGTREQLSILVRLGFAELLAARGNAVPLVLDDPLVYSDDERLAKLCRVLEVAAHHIQIIILSCRATAFQTLPGHRVSVTSWRPEA